MTGARRTTAPRSDGRIAARLLPRRLLAGSTAVLAAVALAACGGSSHAAGTTTKTPPPGRRGGDLAIAAAYLGLTRSQLRTQLQAGRSLAEVASGVPGRSPSGLIEALVRARTERLNAAVAAGTLSRDQETARLARVRAKVVREVDRTRSRAARTPALAAAARYLGISHARLRSELRSGRTLAQIAAATPGRSTGGLIDAIVAQRRARIEAAASAGRISRSREASSLAGLRRRVTAAVERSPSASERAGPSSGGSAGEAGEPGEGAERGEAPEGEPGEAPEAEAGAEGSGARER